MHTVLYSRSSYLQCIEYITVIIMLQLPLFYHNIWYSSKSLMFFTTNMQQPFPDYQAYAVKLFQHEVHLLQNFHFCK